jgi:hypothetical protein
MSLRKHFQTSLDLPGVNGAFCITGKGELIESFMPVTYTDAIFEELGPRIVALVEAVDMSYNPTNELLLQFGSNSLFMRRNENVLIGFFTERDPLLPGLRVSANLLLKQAKAHLDEAVEGLTSRTAPSAERRVEENSDEDDEPVILQSTPSPAKEPKTEKKRRGLFGLRKPKDDNKPDDIWG